GRLGPGRAGRRRRRCRTPDRASRRRLGRRHLRNYLFQRENSARRWPERAFGGGEGRRHLRIDDLAHVRQRPCEPLNRGGVKEDADLLPPVLPRHLGGVWVAVEEVAGGVEPDHFALRVVAQLDEDVDRARTLRDDLVDDGADGALAEIALELGEERLE